MCFLDNKNLNSLFVYIAFMYIWEDVFQLCTIMAKYGRKTKALLELNARNRIQWNESLVVEGETVSMSENSIVRLTQFSDDKGKYSKSCTMPTTITSADVVNSKIDISYDFPSDSLLSLFK